MVCCASRHPQHYFLGTRSSYLGATLKLTSCIIICLVGRSYISSRKRERVMQALLWGDKMSLKLKNRSGHESLPQQTHVVMGQIVTETKRHGDRSQISLPHRCPAIPKRRFLTTSITQAISLLPHTTSQYATPILSSSPPHRLILSSLHLL